MDRFPASERRGPPTERLADSAVPGPELQLAASIRPTRLTIRAARIVNTTCFPGPSRVLLRCQTGPRGTGRPEGAGDSTCESLSTRLRGRHRIGVSVCHDTDPRSPIRSAHNIAY